MPEGWNCGDECLLNALYTWARTPRQFPAGHGATRASSRPVRRSRR